MTNQGQPKPAVVETLRRQWARVVLRGVHFSDSHRRLDALYRISDPWEMETPAQRFRFAETNRLIEAHFGPVGRLLEVGCGEGHQSRELVKACDDLVGIDISPRAIERARVRCPGTAFVAGDIFAPNLADGGRFDLVVGCEVLYYMKDVDAALHRFAELGRAWLVTYYDRPAAALDKLVLSRPGVVSATIEYESSRWTVAWRRND